MKRVRRNLPAKWLRASRVCVALGDAHRQRILLLFDRGERLSMRQILETSPLSRTAVAHHLRVMRDAGVLSVERDGKEAFYRIEKDYARTQLAAVIAYIDDEL
jgi:ArsR family transcriptional regulator, arsenate/arsenite/antimonite-responsive transcriptional repressor